MSKFGLFITIIMLVAMLGCAKQEVETTSIEQTVPQENAWGIYALDLVTNDVTLIFSSTEAISYLSLNKAGTKFSFTKKVGGSEDTDEEIFTINIDGTGLTQLTNNDFWDLYATFSADDSKLVFLSRRAPSTTLDLYTMNADGNSDQLLYDSGEHDSDVNWGNGGKITFTRNDQIWVVNEDGTSPTRLTDPANAGEWGIANLPIGDYDPRFSPGGSKIVFERMVDVDSSPHGSYDIFVINSDGTGETRLTTTGYSQGLANWSNAGDKLVYIVAAIGTDGKFDLYTMNADGTNSQNITPDYFPDNLLCHAAMFSQDDSKVYFTGQWY